MNNNQPRIDSSDQHQWMAERLILVDRVKNFCQDHNVDFVPFISGKIDFIKNSTRDKIVYMCLFDLIFDYTYWQKINQACVASGKILFVITDNILKFDDLEFVNFFSCPELLGVTAYDIPINAHRPNKLYNCFIQRVDSVRQSWFYFLYHHDLLDQGYVSLLLKQLTSYSSLTGKELFDYIHQQHALYQLPHFEQAYQNVKNQVPYRNFVEEYNLLPLTQDSKYSLVLETYAVDDDRNQWCFTEKLFRALQSTSFVLPFCQKRGIATLKSLGFKFNLDLDHLDQLSWQERQQQLLNFLINDTLDYDANVLYNISLHNQQLLKSWKVRYQKPDFFDNIFNKVIEF